MTLQRGGHYILIVMLGQARWIPVGRLGMVPFAAGYYAYVGSALGGLGRRLARHLGPRPVRRHWHIDHLLQFARPQWVVYAPMSSGKECPLTLQLSDDLEGVAGFGASDCTCPTHLFRSENLETLLALSRRSFRRIGRRPQSMEVTPSPSI
jgi:Uri superfamily endonuclease